jgi:hypothetical protein
MLVDDEEENDAEDLLKLAKVQKQLNGIKNSDAISKSLLAAVSAMSEAIEDMAEAQKNNSFYDKDLGKSLSESMTKLSESMLAMAKEQKVDLAPLIKSQAVAMRELQTQNNEVIKAITTKTEKPEKNDNAQVLKAIAESIKSSNESLKASLKAIDYSQVLNKIAERPTSWTHKIFRNEIGKVSRIVSKIGEEK